MGRGQGLVIFSQGVQVENLIYQPLPTYNQFLKSVVRIPSFHLPTGDCIVPSLVGDRYLKDVGCVVWTVVAEARRGWCSGFQTTIHLQLGHDAVDVMWRLFGQMQIRRSLRE